MKQLFYLALLGLLFILNSCQSNRSGSYVVYDVSTYDRYLSDNGLGESYPNDTITTYLKNKMMGTKINLQFTDDYVKVTVPGSDDELYLKDSHKTKHDKIYTYDHRAASKVWSYILYRNEDDGKVIFQVALRMRNEPLIMPVQLGGPYGDFPKVGVAICTLSKVDK